MSAKMQPWLWLVFSVKLAGKTQSGLAQACTRAENVDRADSATGGTDRIQAVGTGQAGGGEEDSTQELIFQKPRAEATIAPQPELEGERGKEEEIKEERETEGET